MKTIIIILISSIIGYSQITGGQGTCLVGSDPNNSILLTEPISDPRTCHLAIYEGDSGIDTIWVRVSKNPYRWLVVHPSSKESVEGWLDEYERQLPCEPVNCIMAPCPCMVFPTYEGFREWLKNRKDGN